MGKGDLGLGGSRAMGQGGDAMVVMMVVMITVADFDDFDAVYLGRGHYPRHQCVISKFLSLASVILPLRWVQGSSLI